MAHLPSRPSLLPDPATSGPVIVGMSGGVDSAVSAWLLQRWGYEVQGLFMSNWEDDADAYCTTAGDYQDARRVCDVVGIVLHRVSFAGEYRQRVFELFLREYSAGRTPNPDVLCNREIKFGVCVDYMRRLGGAWIATGHYARVVHGARRVAAAQRRAMRPRTRAISCTASTPAALARCLFPLGELTKGEVRAARARRGPAGARQARQHRHLLHRRTPLCGVPRPLPSPATRADADRGRADRGEHQGLPFYTLGQRSGLKLGGRAGAAQAPWYVADKDSARNALIVVQRPDHPLLLSRSFEVTDLQWLAEAPAAGTRCQVKPRYRQRDLPCRVYPDRRSAGASSSTNRSAPRRRASMRCSTPASSAWAAA